MNSDQAERIKIALDGAALIAVTDHYGAITFANEKYLSETGFSLSEITAAGMNLIDPALNSPEIIEQASQGIPRGEVWRGEIRSRTKPGTELWLDVTLVPFVTEGVPAQCVAICLDITERRRTETALRETEEQLRQSQRLEAVGKLAGGIAHDFNNLLAVILLHTDLLLARTAIDDPQRHRIDEIRAATERASSLTRQLLAFSRAQVMQPRILELNTVVTETSRMLRRLIGEDIDLRITLSETSPLIMADPDQLAQVLLNLAVNSRDAMPRGGALTIVTGRMDLPETQTAFGLPAGSYAALTVSDNGQGMSPEVAERAFEPFFSTRGPGHGSGLGLSTVYGIVRQSGGDIMLESRPEVGTSIRILLPIVEEQTRDASEPEEESQYLGNETVLVVEDEDPVRRIACEVLNLYGYQVVAAQHGAEAIALVRDFAGPIHLLLTDVVMPKMGGPELARELVRMRPGLRVLFMSGYTGDRIGEHGGDTKPPQFLPKPFTRQELARRVREVLDDPNHG